MSEDLRVAVCTWNMSFCTACTKNFSGDKHGIFDELDLENTDMVIFTGQDVKNRTTAIGYIEDFLKGHNYVNVDSSFAAQGDMFLVIFVKAHLHRHTSSVEHMAIPKGAGTFGSV